MLSYRYCHILRIRLAEFQLGNNVSLPKKKERCHRKTPVEQLRLISTELTFSPEAFESKAQLALPIILPVNSSNRWSQFLTKWPWFAQTRNRNTIIMAFTQVICLMIEAIILGVDITNKKYRQRCWSYEASSRRLWYTQMPRKTNGAAISVCLWSHKAMTRTTHWSFASYVKWLSTRAATEETCLTKIPTMSLLGTAVAANTCSMPLKTSLWQIRAN